MTLLSSAQLAAMRATAELALPDTCTIERATNAANAIGEIVRTWATLASGVPCRLSRENTREDDYGARVAVVGALILTVAWDQAITEADRAIVGAHTYEVLGLLRSSWMTCQRCLVAEVA